MMSVRVKYWWMGVAALACVGGCASTTAMQGARRDVEARYSCGSLRAELPGEVGVMTVRAAAESVMRARGYVVADAGGTTERTYVVGRRYPDALGETVTTSATLGPRGTEIRIDPGFAGDEAMCRGMLEAILARLGR